jgi:hypothetical protein
MHVVDNDAWELRHGDMYEDNLGPCKTCHGVNLEGTVLSRAAADRVYLRNDDGGTISIAKGTPVNCTSMCHGYPD